MIFRGRHEVLLVERLDDSGGTLRWELPGGRLQEGETLDEAFSREILEEVGINAISGNPVHVWAFSTDDGESVLALARDAIQWHGQLSLSCRDASERLGENRWFQISALPESIDENSRAAIARSMALIPRGEKEQKFSECVLCQVLDESPDAPIRTSMDQAQLPSEVLCESAFYVAVSDVAPLTPGHLLIVSREHTKGLFSGPRSHLVDLEGILEYCSARLQAIYGKRAIAFEHGACVSDQGCGISHAHLHVLPLEASLMGLAEDLSGWREYDSLESASDAVPPGTDYLLIVEGRVNVRLGSAPSQVLRRRISGFLGTEFWNWSDTVLLGRIPTDSITALHASWKLGHRHGGRE